MTLGRGEMPPWSLERQISEAVATAAAAATPHFSCDLNPPLKPSWALGQGVSHGQRHPVLKAGPLGLPVRSGKWWRPPPADNIEIYKEGSPPRTLATLPP